LYIPDRIVDEVMLAASPSAVRLVLALFRHGTQHVDDGVRRAQVDRPHRLRL